MKIVVGGSYHDPNWAEVQRVIKELENAGHTIIAPGMEWNPISESGDIPQLKSQLERTNSSEDFIRFVGELEFSKEILQSMFYKKIFTEADAFVVVDRSGYLGKTVTQEVIAATAINVLDMRNLPVYFTEPPIIREIFDSGLSVYSEHFQELFNDSDCFQEMLRREGHSFTESDFKIKFLGPDEAREKLIKSGVKITQEEYDLLYPFHYELYKFMVKYPTIYNVGLNNLLYLKRTEEKANIIDEDREIDF